MKGLLTTILAGILTLHSFSQQVNIIVTGSKKHIVVVDDKVYPALRNTASTNSNEVIISGLGTGEHRLSIFRIKDQRRKEIYSSTFVLRDGYDISIQFNTATGRVRLLEISNYLAQGKADGSSGGMPAHAFEHIYSDIKKKWLPGAKMNAAVRVFSNGSNYFSSIQARELIGLVSNEYNRLELARLAYDNVTDPEEYFETVAPLLITQQHKDALRYFLNNRLK